MYSMSYTGTSSPVLCREGYHTVSLFGRAHYRRLHCTLNSQHKTLRTLLVATKAYKVYSGNLRFIVCSFHGIEAIHKR